MKFIKKAQIELLEQNPKILGWIVTWDLAHNGNGYPVSQVRELFEKHKLPNIVDGIRDRSAVIRALRVASKGKLKSLDILEDNEDEIQFQISRISVEEDKKYKKLAKYILDAVITYDKRTRKIDCDNDSVRKFVMDKFLVCKENYKTTDLTRLLLELFRKNADIVSLRSQGGAYMVPYVFGNYVKAVAGMLKDLGGGNRLRPYTLMKDDDNHNAVAMRKDAVEDKLSLLEQVRQNIQKMREEDEDKDDDEKKAADSRTKKKNTLKKLKSIGKKISLWEQSLQFQASDARKALKDIEQEALKFFGAEECS